MKNKLVPYNTGKVLIGCRYEIPQHPVSHSADEMLLQRALLGVKNPFAIRFANIIKVLKGEANG